MEDRLQKPPVAGGDSRWVRPAALAIVLAGIAAYSNTFRCPFIFDDHDAIRHNVYVRRLWPLSYSMNAPPESSVAGRPIVSFTLALNYAFDGVRVRGYHVVNLAIHLLAGLTLFGIVRRTLLTSRRVSLLARSATGLAFAAALLWTVHPLQTEAVTYIIQRAESLCGLFYLLTLYCALRGFSGLGPVGWYAGAIVACGLGMATKELMVTAPFLIFVFDRIFFAESFKEQLHRRGLYYLVLSSTWFILAALIWEGPRSASAGFAVESSTPLSYALTQFGVILHYLRLSLMPFPLCLDYAWPLAKAPLEVIVPAMAICALLAATVWALWRQPPLGFLGVWLFVILSPTSSFVPIEDRAFEHRMYLSLAAIIVLIVIIAHWLLQRVAHPSRLVPIILVAATSLGFIALTMRRNYDYRTEISIWNDVVAKRPDNPRALDSLGTAYFRLDKFDEAESLYHKVLARWPDHSDSHHNLASVYAKKGDYPKAVAEFRESVRFAPAHPGGHYNLGLVLAETGQVQEALYEYGEALRIDPTYAEAHNSVGRLLAKLGRLDEAVEQYRQAIYYKPEWPRVHNNLGNVLSKQGKIDDAIEHFNDALWLEPNWAEVHSNLGIALARQGRIDEAIVQFQTAIQLKPGIASPYYNLAQALMKKGKADEALKQCRYISEARPHDAEPLYFLGQLLVQAGRRDEAIEQFRAALKIDPKHRGAAARLSELTTSQPITTSGPSNDQKPRR